MVNFFGEWAELIGSVTTVVKEVSKEVASEVGHIVSAGSFETASAPPPKHLAQKRDNAVVEIPRSVDLTYVTERWIAMPQPVVDTIDELTYDDPGRPGDDDDSEIEGEPSQDTVQSQHESGESSSSPPLPLETPRQHQQHVGMEAEMGTTANAATSTSTAYDAPTETLMSPMFPPSRRPTPTHRKSKNNNSNNTQPNPFLRNDVHAVAQYLNQKHPGHHLLFNLTEKPADDITKAAFSRQIVNCPWKSPSSPRSETPNLSALLGICYRIHAYLQAHSQNTAVIYCSNGKTRTAIVMACLGKYIGRFASCREGFGRFLQATSHGKLTLEQAQDIMEHSCPPSLHTFMANFDRAVDLEGYMNGKPLLLRAIALQGIPVEDKPCLDIWDGQQQHVYSSHPELWNDVADTPTSTSSSQAPNSSGSKKWHVVAPQPPPFSHLSSAVVVKMKNVARDAAQYPLPPQDEDDDVQALVLPPPHKTQSQWADEEGFYRVNIVLEGDFCLLCRFGGVHAEGSRERYDATKVLFRYANSTGFLGAGGPYELPPSKIDLMRRYAHCFEEDEFLCTLIFEAHWNLQSSTSDAPEVQNALRRPCSPAAMPPVYGPKDVRALQLGWQGIAEGLAAATPTTRDLERMARYQGRQLGENSDLWTALCLQLSNYDFLDALEISETWSCHKRKNLPPLQQLLQMKLEEKPIDPQPTIAPRILPLSTLVFVQSNTEQSSPEKQQAGGDEGEVTAKDDKGRSRILKEATQNILNILDLVELDREQIGFGTSQKAAPAPPKPDRSSAPNAPNVLPASSDTNNTNFMGRINYTSPFNLPSPGDVVNAFGEYYEQIHKRTASSQQPWPSTKSLSMGTAFPRLPLQAGRSGGDSAAAGRRPPYSPVDDPANAASVELLMKLNHPGINLHDLTQLMEDSRHWNDPKAPPVVAKDEDTKEGEEEGVLVAMGRAGTVDTEDTEKATSESAPPLKDHPAYSQYFRMLKNGRSIEDVKETMKKDGKDPTLLDLDPEQSLSSQRPSESEYVVVSKSSVQNAQKALQAALTPKKDGSKAVSIPRAEGSQEDPESPENPQAKLLAAFSKDSTSSEVKDDAVILREDPDYAKYFKMLKLGMPREQVQHAVTRDGKDISVLELDPERSLACQRKATTETTGDSDEVALKDDPAYSKYFKMMKMGMPQAQVAHAVQRDGNDPKILELDPNKSLVSQQLVNGASKEDCGRPLKEDPDFAKYFKMLNMGMPQAQVAHAVERDGKDPKILEFDPNKSLVSQQGVGPDAGPALKDDEEYKKFFKMLKMGMAKEQVAHAAQRDGKDPKVLDLDPDKSLKSQLGGGGGVKDDGPPLKDDEEYKKYFKMIKMGMAKEQVAHAVQRDGKDPSVLDLDPNKSLKSQVSAGQEPNDEGPPLKEDPEYVKFFKMLGMGLPKDAVKNALMRDGKDPAVLDLDPNKSLKFQLGGAGENKDTGVPLKEDPEYIKYFKMLGMGLPKDAVKNALLRDGKDPKIMDMDPNHSLEFQQRSKSSAGVGARRSAATKKKKRVRRKKIYWNPINPDQIKEDSLWNIVKGSVKMDTLKYDVKEFEELFTESADPADRDKEKKTKNESKQKKSVQVIDGKRSMNGGIILARVKVRYEKIAKIVDMMEHGKFDTTQLKALKDFLPNIDERQGLLAYMKKNESSPVGKEQAYKELSECEKYMYHMLDVPNADQKFDCMLFRNQFRVRYEDLTDAIATVERACDEMKNSERLRQMMAIILVLVNQINTGGEEGPMAEGFSLDALLKLNEAKAFDKKTSVLMYLAKLVKKNDESLLNFDEDLKTVRHAENIVLDSLVNDIKNIEAELKQVHATAAAEAEKLEAAGNLRPMTLQDLKELRTSLHVNESVTHFNRVDHHSGRTPIERFSISCGQAMKHANESVDRLKANYSNLLDYFGEDEKMASDEFFGVMRRFIEAFTKAKDQVEQLEQARIKEEKRNAKRAEKVEKRSSVKASVTDKKEKKKTGRGTLASLAAMTSLGKGGGAAEGTGSITSLGGLAAMASAAAAKKTGASPAPGGLAAMAAAAAAKKNSQPNPAPGGLAALAAAAAAKKTGASPAPGGLAALAAVNKASGTSSTPGGLAAMAAAAANRKSVPASEYTPSCFAVTAAGAAASKTLAVGASPAAGGIAAMAALAAARKQQGKGTGLNQFTGASAAAAPGVQATPSLGGIAAMAAAAAAKGKAPITSSGTGGIAALAATAAARRSQSSSVGGQPGSDSVAARAPAPGGIEAMAAAAAVKKSAGPQPQSIISSGGIASLAAAAAARKGQLGVASSQAPPTTGGIAAMAAAAARKSSTFSSGAITGSAAAAAGAASRTQGKGSAEKPAEKSEGTKADHTTGPSSIAALAAAVVLKNMGDTSKEQNELQADGTSLDTLARIGSAKAFDRRSSDPTHSSPSRSKSTDFSSAQATPRKDVPVRHKSSEGSVLGSLSVVFPMRRARKKDDAEQEKSKP